MKALSPSAINTFHACKRKYFYRYIQRMPEKKSINLIAGAAVHKAIKDKSKSPSVPINSLFKLAWENSRKDLKKLNISRALEMRYFRRYLKMALNWQRMQSLTNNVQSEVYLKSRKYKCIGIIDEIVSLDGMQGIAENKTCSSDRVTDEIKLQLGIYALLYHENFNKWPDFLMLRFLRNGTYKLLTLDNELLENVIKACRVIRKRTSMNISDYPKAIGRFCKWKGGECSYFEICKPFQNS